MLEIRGFLWIQALDGWADLFATSKWQWIGSRLGLEADGLTIDPARHAGRKL
jgi:hypothetical protein